MLYSLAQSRPVLPVPPWRTRFDDVSNLVGYLPLGALLYVAVRRSGGHPAAAWALGLLGPAALALSGGATRVARASRRRGKRRRW